MRSGTNRVLSVTAVLGVTLLGVALVGAGRATATPPGRSDAAAGRGPLRLNQLQLIGTHNSYHVEASAAEQALRAQVDPQANAALQYGHPPLAQQLGGQNVRQLELDVFADPKGGLFAAPLLRELTGGGPYDPVLARPGAKVLHVQDLDYRSTCLTLRRCLADIKAWSDAHRSHVPVAVLLELKDDTPPVAGLPRPLVSPVPWTTRLMDGLDAEIRSVFPRERLLTPDDVRGRRPTLESAVLGQGWPSVDASRGKVLFLMDNAGAYRTAYLAGHPALRGRVMFTNSTPGQPDAAFVEENDPTGAAGTRIADLVRHGYLVRTRADADTVQARTGDTTQRDAALASGAQWVSTDYPVPGLAARWGTDYVAQLPGGAAVRCNPVSAPARCTPPPRP